MSPLKSKFSVGEVETGEQTDLGTVANEPSLVLNYYKDKKLPSYQHYFHGSNVAFVFNSNCTRR